MPLKHWCHMRMYKCTCTHTHVQARTRTRTHTHTQTRMHKHRYMHRHAHTLPLHTNILRQLAPLGILKVLIHSPFLSVLSTLLILVLMLRSPLLAVTERRNFLEAAGEPSGSSDLIWGTTAVQQSEGEWEVGWREVRI